MTDIANLGLNVDSSQVKKATDDLKGLDNQADRTEKKTGKLSNGFARLKDVGRSLTRVLGPLGLAASFAALTASVISFDNALGEVSTLLSGDVQGQMAMITEQSVALAQSFAGSPTEQAAAFYQAISAGAGNAAQATDLLITANRLAVGGVTDVKTAVDGLTTVVNAYGPDVISAQEASDTLFVGMRAGKTTIEELSRSLGRVVPIAAAVGVTFDDLVSSAAAITTQGLSTEETMTSLRAIINSVLQPTTEASELAEQLGLDWSAAGLKAEGLTGFMENLQRATGGNVETISTLIPNTRALVGALALMGVGGEKAAAILEDMSEKAGQTDQAFNRIAARGGFQLARVFDNIVATITGAGQALLDTLAPALTVINKNFQLMIDVLKSMALAFAFVAAPSAIVAGLGLITSAFVGLSAVIAANPIVAFITLVGAAIGVLNHFKDELVVVRDEGLTLGDVFFGVSATIMDGLGAVSDFVVDNLIPVWTLLASAVKQAFDFVIQTIEDAINFALEAVNFVRRQIGKDELGAVVIGTLDDIGDAILQNARARQNERQGLVFGPQLPAEAPGKKPGADTLVPPVIDMDEVKKTEELQTALNAIMDELDPISAAVREYADATDVLSEARDKGLITAEEEIEIIGKLDEKYRDTLDPMGALNRAFDEQARLISLTSDERRIEEEVLAAVNDLKSKGIELDQEEIDGIRGKIEALDMLNEKRDQEEAMLERLHGSSQRATEDLATLIRIRDQLTDDQFTNELRRIQTVQAEQTNTIGAGFDRAFLALEEQSTDVAGQAQHAFESAFGGAADAIQQFVKTGRIDLQSFVSDISSSLLKSGLETLFVGGGQALGFGAGGTAGGIFGSIAQSFLGGFDGGGSFTVGGNAGVDQNMLSINGQPVAAVSRGEDVSVTPSGQSAGNVTVIVNTRDPDTTIQLRRSQTQQANRDASRLDRANRRR